MGAHPSGQALDVEQPGHLSANLSQGTLTLFLQGRLDSTTTGALWQQALRLTSRKTFSHMAVDASEVEYCDGAGIALLVQLRRMQFENGGDFTLIGLKTEFQQLLDLFGPRDFIPPQVHRPQCANVVEEIGRAFIKMVEEWNTLLAFVGELSLGLMQALMHPKKVRWKDALLVAEQVGVNALPIIALIGTLLGLVMAFQGAVALQRFGADIFVANLMGLSMLRELGPLITAIILAGRSGSAFAAELGTMKVREEIDALTTMGLEPVQLLIVPRVIAAGAMTPILTMFSIVFGLAGGAVVMVSMGYPLVTYINQIQSAVNMGDFLGGLVKSVVFGFVVAAIGCLRGLQTQSGASAVGKSTTSSVVSGLVLIAIVDGLFAVLYFVLEI